MKWYKLPEEEISEQPFIKKIKVGGQNICLVNYAGDLFAVNAKCPHAGEDLSRGWCADGRLVCPYHRFSYDLKTGKGSTGQNDFVESYPVKIKGDKIYIGISSFWDKIMGRG
ncbi:hypothetical protein A0256_19090 [Mucilaginibacter sp. PAMC 26640]|nr:hypothetical protein A0256_19090 [Mucilaginibacter sp. PAMC 26640]